MVGYYDHPYWGSGSMREYIISPIWAKTQKETPTEKNTQPIMFGRAFHRYIECQMLGMPFDMEIVEPAINKSTGAAYGFDTKAQKDHLAQFENPCLVAHYEKIVKMFNVISRDPLIKKWLGMQPETEYYNHADKTKAKIDDEGKNVIIDWKSTDKIINLKRLHYELIMPNRLDLQACHYQNLIYELTGELKNFFWVFIQKTEPIDYVIVSAKDYTYSRSGGCIITAPSMFEYQKEILGKHRECVKNDFWPGLQSQVLPNWRNEIIFNPLNTNFNF